MKKSDVKPVGKFANLMDIIVKKITDIAKLNGLIFIFSIPSLFIMTTVVLNFYNWIDVQLNELVVEAGGNLSNSLFTLLKYQYSLSIYDEIDKALVNTMVCAVIALLFMVVPMVTFGPAAIGATKVYKAMVQRKPYFIWNDFIVTFKSYFNKAFIVSVIDIVVLCLILYAMYFYLFFNLATGLLQSLILVVIIIVLLIFAMMHFYIYQLIYEYNLSIFKAYKYSITFSMLRFIPNLLILIVIGAITILPYWLYYIAGGAFTMVFGFAIPGVIINYFTWPALKKNFEPLLSRK